MGRRLSGDQKLPTIQAVAERAGVSIASVSRVLNGKGHVSPATAEKVRRAVRELGYIPNHVAKSLKARRTEQIAFAVSDIGNPVYVAMARAVQAEAKAWGYRVILLSTDANPTEELEVLRSLRERYADGLILCPIRITPGHVRALERAAAPVVVIGSLPPDVPVDNVAVDSHRGALQAMEHLIGQGFTRIAFINGPSDTVPGGSRLRAYREALLNHGLPWDPQLVVSGDFQMAGGYQAAEQLLALPKRPEAVFCANDLMALGAMRRFREAGLQIPQDLAIVGMDDIEHAAIATPALTSVSLCAAERGRLAAQMLFRRLSGEAESLEPQRVTVTPRLVVRESSLMVRSQ
ncbi:MAG TPA: LacI family DNA-binding transcriptional regulator [Symbiobacteriaceae bacterium]